MFDGKIADMILNQGDHSNSDDEDDIVESAEDMLTDDMVKMCDELIEGLAQCVSIAEQKHPVRAGRSGSHL